MIRVSLIGWREGLQKIALARLLREDAGLSLAAAKHAVDDVLEGRAVTVTLPSTEAAERFAAASVALGIICRVESE